MLSFHPSANVTSLPVDLRRVRLLARGFVATEPGRCVQCGICAHNCPMGVEPRAFASRDVPVLDERCILCGSCISRCPRGALRFVRFWGDRA